MEPLSTLHDAVEVKLIGLRFGNSAMGAVVDHLRRTHRSTCFGIIQTHTVATTYDETGVHTIATKCIHGNLSYLVLGQLGYETCLMPIVGYADGHIGLTAAGDDSK